MALRTLEERAFMFTASFDWNNVPVHRRSLSSFGLFKNALFSYLKPKLIIVSLLPDLLFLVLLCGHPVVVII